MSRSNVFRLVAAPALLLAMTGCDEAPVPVNNVDPYKAHCERQGEYVFKIIDTADASKPLTLHETVKGEYKRATDGLFDRTKLTAYGNHNGAAEINVDLTARTCTVAFYDPSKSYEKTHYNAYVLRY
jgi:hypothetical protein